MLTALYTILVFGLIISIHEFGHFVMAKLNKITVHEFSIGMGPRIWHQQGKNTEYALRILPIGGYVRLEGEDEESDDTNAFCNKKPWRRLSVLFAGAFMNFLLGFLIFIMLFSMSSGIATNVVGDVIENSAFADAGMRKNDKIIFMESGDASSGISDYNDINYFLSSAGDNPVIITFERENKTFRKSIEPKYNETYGRKMMGFSPHIEKPGFFNVIKASYRQSIFVIKVVANSFAGIFTGKISFSQMSGPVGIVNEIGNAAREGMKLSFLQGLLNVLSLAALISINLGVVNLLPLPALDGGRILFILIELIFRKPVPKEKEGVFHMVGFALLIALMISITVFDIGRIMN